MEDLIDSLYDVSSERLIEVINELGLAGEVTVVYATYNRPHSLCWSINSLLGGDIVETTGIIGKTIIVNDDSTNPEVKKALEDIKNQYNGDVDIYGLSERRFPSNARDYGIGKAETKYVYIGDDDSLPNSTWPLILVVLETLLKGDDSIAGIMGPIYFRSTVPKDILTKNDIGSLSVFGVNSNFDSFPSEYIEDMPTLDVSDEIQVPTPFSVQNTGNNLLLRRDVLEEVGGYNKDNTIEIIYGDETNLARKISEMGYKLLFLCSPAVAHLHLKVGFPGESSYGNLLYATHYGFDEDEIQRMIEFSKIENYDSGGRHRPDVWMYLRWRNFTSISKKRGVRYLLGQVLKTFYECIRDETKYYKGTVPFSARLLIAIESTINGCLGYTKPLNEIL